MSCDRKFLEMVKCFVTHWEQETEQKRAENVAIKSFSLNWKGSRNVLGY